ncbi:MAG: SGNH/GDSL hydrolase family protein [Pseudomonadota bacterium]
MKRRLWLAAVIGLWPSAVLAEGPVLVMGDSIMAWNGAASLAAALERGLDRPVENASVPGAQIAPRGLRRLVFEIGAQYTPGDWSWVVLNGGANDLFDRCGCQRCDDVLDDLVAADGRRGEIANIVDDLRQTGARVLYLGYYGPSGRGGDFDICEDELTELDARMARMAQIVPELEFIDGGDAMSAATPDDYDADNVHPAPRGSAKLGALAAAAIGRAEAR